MSTDFDLVCDRCRRYVHLGQRFTSGYTFGYGTGDETGQQEALRFIDEHLDCNDDGMRVVLTDSIPDGYARLDGSPVPGQNKPTR